MRILYSAIDQVVPGTKGGSTHVTAVAEGLSALGHQVHVLVTPGEGAPPRGVDWIPMSPPFGANQLRWTRSGAVAAIIGRLEPEVIMERYYNFGGEAILHARRAGARAVLEVNAPVIDHPGSTKALIDRALVKMPLKLRTPWVLRHVVGCSLDDIAAACECSLATVKRRISDADDRVARHLGPVAEDES